jgi:hypothetical protein
MTSCFPSPSALVSACARRDAERHTRDGYAPRGPSFRDDLARDVSHKSNATTFIQSDDLISRLEERRAMAGNNNHRACLTAREQSLDEFGFRVDV